MKGTDHHNVVITIGTGILILLSSITHTPASNPCDAISYQTLHRKALDSLSDRELYALLGLHDNCIDWMEARTILIDPCDDSTYVQLSQKRPDDLSQNQLKYLQQLNEDCTDYQSDMNRDAKWKETKPKVVTGIVLGVLAVITVFVVIPVVLVFTLTNYSR